MLLKELLHMIEFKKKKAVCSIVNSPSERRPFNGHHSNSKHTRKCVFLLLLLEEEQRKKLTPFPSNSYVIRLPNSTENG
jgi:hypothetical protein